MLWKEYRQRRRLTDNCQDSLALLPHLWNTTVSFNVHNPIREQLDSLTSIVYNMYIQKEENNRPFKPQIHQKKRRGQNRQNFGNRDRNRSYSEDRQRQNFRSSYRRHPQDRQCRCDSRRGSYGNQNYDSRDRGRPNFRRSFSNDRYDNRNRSRTRERSLTPRKNDNRRHDSSNENLGTRNRSNSRVTTNRNRIRCYRCGKYDHFANECPNAVTDDSDGYESDRAALQVMTVEAEILNNFDIARPNEETCKG